MINKFIFFISIFFITTKSAFAYIDPGIGAIFVQGLIGIIAGISLFFSRVRETLIRWLGLSKKETPSKVDKKNSQHSNKLD